MSEKNPQNPETFIENTNEKTTVTGKTKPRKPMVPRKVFCREWQLAENMEIFCENTGLQKGAASARATKYRNLGIRLKRMPAADRSNRINVDELNTYLDSLTTEN